MVFVKLNLWPDFLEGALDTPSPWHIHRYKDDSWPVSNLELVYTVLSFALSDVSKKYDYPSFDE